MQALCGMLVAALLWYRKFRGDLESEQYVFNPYNPCVANKTIEKKQHTVRFQVDDLMASHVLPKINDRFDTCGSTRCMATAVRSNAFVAKSMIALG